MNKLFGVCFWFFSIACFPTVVNAGVAFLSALIPCGATGSESGCGSNPQASDPLRKGSVKVLNNGKVMLRLSGAVPNKKYLVVLHNWVIGGGPQHQFSGAGHACPPGFGEFSTITTDRNGDFAKVLKDISTGEDFVFPSGTTIGQPNFVINDEDCTRTQFTSGFYLGTQNKKIQNSYPHQEAQ